MRIACFIAGFILVCTLLIGCVAKVQSQHLELTQGVTTADEVLVAYGQPTGVMGNYANPVYVYQLEQGGLVIVFTFQDRLLTHGAIMTPDEFNAILETINNKMRSY